MKKKENLLRNPYVRILIVTSFIILVIAAIVFVILLGNRFLFRENPRFTLRNVFVSSSGYWNGRSDEVMNMLNLKKGRTNLFEVSPKKLRETLKKKKMYSIENVEISRILPNTLKFDIVEKIPRALLYNRKSNLIVDRKGILLNRKYCVNINKELPVITGFILKKTDFTAKSYKKVQIPFGKKLPQVMPALVLISLIHTDYPEFRIKLINLCDPNSLIVHLLGPKNRKVIKVILPFKHNTASPLTEVQLTQETYKLRKKLEELQELYCYLKLRRKKVTEINLIFDKQAILK
jgi:hypothetical protein